MDVVQVREAVKRFSNEFDVPLTDIVVTHGAALTCLGLVEVANDVDITVPQTTFNRFIESGFMVIPTTPCRMLIQVNPEIDIHTDLNEMQDVDIIVCEGVRFTNIRRTYLDYLHLNREKDQEKIRMLKNILAPHSSLQSKE